LPGGRLAAPALDARLRTAEDLAAAVAPAVRAFLNAPDTDPA
ncbi:alpha/beta hydrolase, partial [Streptomyces sp. SID10815]|nr:alpha/beta hydrolase [Streptomyces sp. SID10815]